MISESMTSGSRNESEQSRNQEILENYKQAFRGFSDDEIAILDGIILKPVKAPCRTAILSR